VLTRDVVSPDSRNMKLIDWYECISLVTIQMRKFTNNFYSLFKRKKSQTRFASYRGIFSEKYIIKLHMPHWLQYNITHS
jgi:hypothetical protein